MKTVKTPKYWKDEIFHPLIEAETLYGNKIKMPRRFSDALESIKMRKADMDRRGLDYLDGLKRTEETNGLYYNLERVYFEIYEEDD